MIDLLNKIMSVKWTDISNKKILLSVWICTKNTAFLEVFKSRMFCVQHLVLMALVKQGVYCCV